MAKMSERLSTILAKHELDPKKAVWDCHGTWIAYHWACEQIARQAGIKFDTPVVVEADSANGIVAVHVTGNMNDEYEWSFGEASPANNKNSYPWAMAEKRAKDRVILKLVGLHGEVYSEEEADDFKKENQKGYLPTMKSFGKDADEDFPSREVNLDTVDGWEGFDKLMRSEMETSENLGRLIALWKDNTASLTEYESRFKTSHEALRKAFTAKKETFK
jgi:hypothetical protein